MLTRPSSSSPPPFQKPKPNPSHSTTSPWLKHSVPKHAAATPNPTHTVPLPQNLITLQPATIPWSSFCPLSAFLPSSPSFVVPFLILPPSSFLNPLSSLSSPQSYPASPPLSSPLSSRGTQSLSRETAQQSPPSPSTSYPKRKG